MSDDVASAALLVIGDEILSGRTKDKNIGAAADFLTGLGVDLREVRVVPDEPDEIVAAVNALRARYTYVLTSGGIGPTHDDITADCVAQAFGRTIDVDPRAKAMLLQRIKPEDLNESRLRMARIPAGADLIENPISRAPGFRVENVFVMAGVPAIMAAMLESIRPLLVGGRPMMSRAIDASGLKEGDYAAALGVLAKGRPTVIIGSYPSYSPEGFRNQIVVRGREAAEVEAVAAEVDAMVAGLGKG